MAFEYNDAAWDTKTSLPRVIDLNRFKEVLIRGSSAEVSYGEDWSPFHEAAIDDSRVECLEELLCHESADVNAKTFFGETPLHVACQYKCVKVVKLLLSHPKCELNTTQHGLSPLHIACSDKSLNNVMLLDQFCLTEPELNGFSPLQIGVSCRKGHIDKGQDEKASEICALLVSHGAQTDCKDLMGNLAFHYACQNGFLKCVEFLYSVSGVRNLINHTNYVGRTPLMIAAAFCNEAVVEMLLSNGANADIEDNKKVTALILAAHSTDYNIFNLIRKATSQQCLIKTCTFDEERYVKKRHSNDRFHSLVCYAIDTNNLEFLIKVLETDIDQAALHCPVSPIKYMTKEGLILLTPISYLLNEKIHDLGDKTIQFLQTLIDHGSPLKMTSRGTLVSYVNPICAALVSLKCSPVVVMKCLRILLSRGADPDTPLGKIPYPMEQACWRGHVDAVLLLLQYSNIIEPKDLIKWIEKETILDADHQIIDALLPLAPHCYTSSTTSQPQVYSLTSWCRAAVRQQIHEETKQSPNMFKECLLKLPVPKQLLTFLQFM